MNVTPHFTRAELEDASGRPLTDAEVERVRVRLLVPLLEPLRVGLGRPVYISSRSRNGVRGLIRDNDSGCHGSGLGADIYVPGVSMRVVWAWIAANLRGEYGEVIEERTHVHVTARGCGGNGEILLEPEEGLYVPVGWSDVEEVLAAAGLGLGAAGRPVAVAVLVFVAGAVARAVQRARG